MLFAIGFVSVFVTGGISGLFLAQPSLDLYLHDTYFVIAHFHFTMGAAALFGIFAGTYFWFPKVTGRMLNQTLGRMHFWFTFLGTYCIFMPMHFLGLAGNPDRYSSLGKVHYLAPLAGWQVFISVAALVTASAQAVFLFNLIWSFFRGASAPPNPWEATTLEWSVSSPPPWNNFPGKLPTVRRYPYEYGFAKGEQDYVMQDETPPSSPGAS